MSVTRKVTGLTMIVAGFTFFAWFVALNTISPAIPEGLQGTAKLFMILSAVTGLGFLISGGMTFFGHDQYAEERKANLSVNSDQKKNPDKLVPKPLFSKSPPRSPSETEEEVVELEQENEGGENNAPPDSKKKEDAEKKEGWDAPSRTGWG